ncbi:bifunctional 2-C-methyl-D-erythritol 4-phosphate cytidylyltransferase/2-C-methyl-D-erythritol 2,4-cyclodiphosphate synthase [Helicobacter sp. MIT 05-5294]|uniref:bifunctional 2-C-methyl-D-erythritol 4-phosphate cytidylyltransferase/2-C-methyl-D-erythritol 2,4-cyclodiphosphate synthase n=1 Tax=Helicobacter sp. MIT 05-5294 TaxID=1548150 RepID=UPI00051FB9E7|nr:bifunctional 2-C-methyl-D-erythritol 4-phosphate cytidylyltransferase/2-C-methyl-D-erythritol 2,4-cyclodiphosphate synthase [Helicobacter sp. MIT 05-5294]TLD87499.1 bifunctional 2-C-methyl-D-erythritol 4-phosphate cytidylyltransferase/2-C-methyl-D-erythritol 2,4-cyclodiphosphate synthase [Helicobacter sp. MIT 05-5294]
MPNIALILLGAGDSSRFQASISQAPLNQTSQTRVTKLPRLPKKQWLRVGEIPLWLKVALELREVYSFVQCILSAKPSEKKYMQKYLDSFGLDFELTNGGNTRQESLKKALDCLNDSVEYVFVSDIARCKIPKDLSCRILDEVGKYDCVVPYLGLSDTIAYCSDSKLEYLKRENLKIIQTPQLSKLNALKSALANGDFTDESSAICANGGSVGFVRGAVEAKKLTFLEDLSEMSLPKPSFRTLVGSGSDIHALDKGNGIVLGGIVIPCEFALIAHSDGDVCLHALSDALLGAIGGGDIGEWFPDNNPIYKQADSAKLLQIIVDFVRDVGYDILQADLTIFAQFPKISPYKTSMERRIAEILQINAFKVNVKATTTEKLGFIGKGEGILVQANVVLGYFNWKNLFHFRGER